MLLQMTKSTVKQILSFSLTFIALAALTTAVILFAEQYTLKDGKIIQTGMIEIKEIQGATVFLDDEEKGGTPIALTYLEEGNYRVKIAKENKKEWERSVEVVAGKVVTLFPIMVPNALQAEELYQTRAVYTTESPLTYLTVQEEGTKLTLRNQTIEKRIFDTSVSTSLLADLKALPESTPSVEFASLEEENADLLSRLKIYPSPTGERVLIVNTDTGRYYLADEQKQNPTDISAWITMPISELFWSSDENTTIILSSSLLIAVNLKNGQNILINNSGEGDYLAVAPLKNRILFGIQNTETDESTLYQVDVDGGNRTELTVPSGGWGDISRIVEMEDKGVLLVETDSGIYQITSQTNEPQLLSENGKIVGIDVEEQLVAVCGGNSEDSERIGRIYHFSKVTLYPFVEVTYPANCEEITHVNFVNTGQNLVIELKDGSIVLTTEEGANATVLTELFPEDQPENITATLLGLSYHRQYLLIHFSVNSDESTPLLYRIAIEN